ncbi:hypothetical protein Pmani_003816 [Petrolisthes manimaculis]|uniref:Uncharacterized protein n=1 Tax=Petrolisthes manimaculis TaxID=1843537 RepID=A0AAE1UPL8_9EUCA|nr:hypothetical protein Pmani_003816 [Petrolisthes manimaculis]
MVLLPWAAAGGLVDVGTELWYGDVNDGEGGRKEGLCVGRSAASGVGMKEWLGGRDGSSCSLFNSTPEGMRKLEMTEEEEGGGEM